MPENCNSAVQGSDSRDKVCIHTDKVYDACKEKDCLEDLRVYLTRSGQEVADRAISIKIKTAEILWVYSDVEAVPFNKGYYTVDLKYFFKIGLDIFTGSGRPTYVEGLATFSKKTILYGSEGNVKIYTSRYKPAENDVAESVKTNLPKVVVEVVDPITLNAKFVDPDQNCCCCCDCDVSAIPSEITKCFDDDLVVSGNSRIVYVTLGIFTIVKLERCVQLLIPVCDFCIPNKDCIDSTDEEPCRIFDRITFPVDEFFPPQDQANESFGTRCKTNSGAGNNGTEQNCGQCVKTNCSCNSARGNNCR